MRCLLAPVLSVWAVATLASGMLRDVSIVYSMEDYPGRVQMWCLKGDSELQLEAERVFAYATRPLIEEVSGGLEMKWIPGGMDARGLVCGTSDELQYYNVTVPIMQPQAELVPGGLSVTLNLGEELRIVFAPGPGPSMGAKVYWKPSPATVRKDRWYEGDVTADGTVVIPFYLLTGSGLYHFAKPNTLPVIDTNHMATLAVLIRDCPKHRWGPDCSRWCPDCMYGGQCHATTGQCVCAPGTMGSRCQTVCPTNTIGQSCTVSVPHRGSSGTQVCVAAPYGCSCAPGYKGPKCHEACEIGTWGADCQNTCSHCLNGCYTESGACKGGLRATCVGGELGLPRLRRPPVVTVSQGGATVSFDAWDATHHDGELPLGYNITGYRLLYRQEGESTELSREVSPPTATLTGLDAATDYLARVVVVVAEGGAETCVVDGSRRGRVHTVHFSTPSPDDPGVPVVNWSPGQNGEVSFSWMADGPGDIYYQYRFKTTPKACRGSPGRFTEWMNTASTSTSATIAPYTTVDLRVRAGNQAGVSNQKQLEFETPPAAPGIKANVRCNTNSCTVIRPGELQCELENGPDLHVLYWIVPAPTQSHQCLVEPLEQQRVNGNTISLPFDELLPYTRYLLKVVYANSAGHNEALVTTYPFQTAAVAPGQVRNLRVYGAPTTLAVTWDPPAECPPTGELENYYVKWGNGGSGSYAHTTDNSYVIEALTPDTEYVVEVSAKNKHVDVASVKGKTEAQKPSPLQNVRVQSVEKDSITLAWDAPMQPGGVLTSHRVTVIIMHRAIVATIDLEATAMAFTVAWLQAGRQYELCSKACNSKGCSDDNCVTEWTKPEEPRVEVALENQESNHSTISILIPQVLSESVPDGPLIGHYVVLVYGSKHVQPTNDDFLDLVNPRSRPSVEKGRIAAFLAEDQLPKDRVFVVGDNKTYGGHLNAPLVDDELYWLAVITMAEAGHHTSHTVSGPVVIQL